LFGSKSKSTASLIANPVDDEKTKVLVLFHTLYGGVYQMAKAVAEGAKSVDSVEVTIKRIPETNDKLDASAVDAQKKVGKETDQISGVSELANYDIVFFWRYYKIWCCL